MLASFLSSFFVVIVVTAFLRLARRYMPAPTNEAKQLDPLEIERLKKTYQSWTALTLVVLLVMAVMSGVLWFFLFCKLGDYLMRPGPDVVFQIDPRHFGWCVPAFLMGIVSGGVLSEFALRLVLGERYTAFKRYAQSKSGIDGSRLMRWTIVLAAVPAATFFVCQACDVTRFTDEGMSLGHFGQFSHPYYPYSAVKVLRFLPLTLDAQGHVKDRPEFVLELGDGTSWTTESLFRDMSPAYDRRAFEYVAAKSGIAIVKQDRSSP